MSGLILLCKDVSNWLGANLNSAQSVFVPRSCRLVPDILLRKAKQHLAHIFFLSTHSGRAENTTLPESIAHHASRCPIIYGARSASNNVKPTKLQLFSAYVFCNYFTVCPSHMVILPKDKQLLLYWGLLRDSSKSSEFCFSIFETSATSEEAAIVTAIFWKLVATQFNLILLHLCFGSTSLNTAPCVELHNCWSNTNGRVSIITYATNALQSRHNGRDHVSNHQPNDCLLNRLFRRYSKGLDGRL